MADESKQQLRLGAEMDTFAAKAVKGGKPLATITVKAPVESKEGALMMQLLGKRIVVIIIPEQEVMFDEEDEGEGMGPLFDAVHAESDEELFECDNCHGRFRMVAHPETCPYCNHSVKGTEPEEHIEGPDPECPDCHGSLTYSIEARDDAENSVHDCFVCNGCGRQFFAVHEEGGKAYPLLPDPAVVTEDGLVEEETERFVCEKDATPLEYGQTWRQGELVYLFVCTKCGQTWEAVCVGGDGPIVPSFIELPEDSERESRSTVADAETGPQDDLPSYMTDPENQPPQWDAEDLKHTDDVPSDVEEKIDNAFDVLEAAIEARDKYFGDGNEMAPEEKPLSEMVKEIDASIAASEEHQKRRRRTVKIIGKNED